MITVLYFCKSQLKGSGFFFILECVDAHTHTHAHTHTPSPASCDLSRLKCARAIYSICMTSTCTFYDIFSTQKRKSHDVQTHFCTRCWDPVFLKTKKNKAGRCYTFLIATGATVGHPVRHLMRGESKAEPRMRRMHGSMPRASIVGLFCFSGVGVCGPHRVQRDSEDRDHIGCATVCLPCQ